MEELIQFLINNWLPILIMITCVIYDPTCALALGFGFMIFGTDNMIFLWIAFILAILNIGGQTYTKTVKKKTIKEDKSKWEM